MTTKNPVDLATSRLADANTAVDDLRAHLCHVAAKELTTLWPSLTAIRFDIQSHSCDDGTYVTSVEDVELTVERDGDPDEIELYVGDQSFLCDNTHEFEEHHFDSWINLGVDNGVLDKDAYANGDFDNLEFTDPALAPLYAFLNVADVARAFYLIDLLLAHRGDDNGDIELEGFAPVATIDPAPIERLIDFMATVPNRESTPEAA
jgi:hypothetical protein